MHIIIYVCISLYARLSLDDQFLRIIVIKESIFDLWINDKWVRVDKDEGEKEKEEEKEKQQLTIFYNGKIVVCDATQLQVYIFSLHIYIFIQIY